MKNTVENKSKFYAQYWGQNILSHPEYKEEDGNSDVSHYLTKFFQVDDGYFLLLKPLSSITDEDVIKVARIISGNVRERIIGKDEYRVLVSIGEGELGVWFDGELLVSDAFQNPLLILECYDYLRSKGYALPYNGLSVEKQVSYGWIKLIEE